MLNSFKQAANLTSEADALQLASQAADSLVEIVRNADKKAAISDSEVAETILLNLKEQYEREAKIVANASQLAKENAELLFEKERDAFMQAAHTQLMDQKMLYEKAALVVANGTKRAQEATEILVEIERKAFRQAAISASEISDSKLMDLKVLYETAIIAATDASQRAKKATESRVEIERNAFKQAAISASEASDSKLMDLMVLHDTATKTAAEASDSLMAIEQSLFMEATKVAGEAFAIQLTDHTKITEHLQFVAKAALMESEQLRSVSANVAHDLKSPLHTLSIGIESMRCGDVSEDSPLHDNQEMLDTLDSACAFMGSAINRTIDYSKTSTGIGLNPSNSSFAILTSLNNPIKWIKSMISNDRIAIQLDPLPQGMQILISDKHWVEENLLCLLSNAVKYSSRGIIHVIVTIDMNMVKITVEDTGIGISEEAKLQLFKQFAKVQSMVVGSTGLGLYSLAKRAEAIGGSCGHDSRRDGKQGSAFWFTFPHRPDSSDDIESVKLSIMPTLEIAEMEVLTILIVDDSPSVIKILSQKLKGFGLSVITACNGADGLEVMVSKKNLLDLVIMDIQMPVMGGIGELLPYLYITFHI